MKSLKYFSQSGIIKQHTERICCAAFLSLAIPTLDRINEDAMVLVTWLALHLHLLLVETELA